MFSFVVFAFDLVGTGSTTNCPNRQAIEQSLNKVHIPGALIVVVNGTNILYEQDFGSQSLLPLKPMHADQSIFVLASISKTFITVVVMQLVEKKLIDLDTDINQYFPNSSNWLSRPPRNVTLYSNEGALLAALVVECVAKISYGQYLRENIFKSLNIYFRTVAVRLSDFQNTEELVKHYAYAVNESFIQQWNHEIPQFNCNLSTSLHFPLFSFSGYPAGLLRMSTISLSMFLRMFINNGYPLHSSQSIAEIYELAWHWRTLSNTRLYLGHGGSLPGMIHLMLTNEMNNTGVIVLTNTDTTAPIDLTREIYETVESIHLTLFQCFEIRFIVFKEDQIKTDT
ncbi:unnamed protein product [Rotaria magnacalcarata]|uniref:Beta-lactamase-related domain-containing protein n=1 Tax=Rotaria magnacalcarata TaxID=392030 RepID=A0A820BWH1_9BILA|nr:unnamed protein product [Rotaria magnacalcarata]CAF4212446.1 unnamed protein product [Rotaria magnacalcarata]